MNLDAGTAVGGTYATTLNVYDSLGVSHALSFSFNKTAANTWAYTITLPTADVSGATAPTTISSGTLSFNGSGVLTTPATSVAGITSPALTSGANPLNFTWDLYDGAGNPIVTQAASASGVATSKQDGYASGSLTGYAVQQDGKIKRDV
jgi:flagellar hook protein FlgE